MQTTFARTSELLAFLRSVDVQDHGSLSSAVLSRQDVVWLYETFLRRRPESEEIIQAQVGGSAAALVAGMLGSAEYQKVAVNELCEKFLRQHPDGVIETDASEADLQRLIEHTRATWEKFGNEEPYWSVLTNESFRKERMAPEVEASFYASGAPDVEVFFEACRRNGVAPPRQGLAVDFGCGVGRVGLHLAAAFDSYLGVDISPSHLATASSQLAARGVANARFERLDRFLDGAETFDCLFSLIVLQHNPPPIICSLLRALLERLRPGGVAYFQIPRVLFGYNYSVAEHLGRLDIDVMEMHAVPQKDIFRIIRDTGCEVLEALPDGKAGVIGLSSTYLVAKP